jgi:hypothetical protein
MSGKSKGNGLPPGVTIDDLLFYFPGNKCIYRPNGRMWPRPAIDSGLRKIDTGRKTKAGNKIYAKASEWLAQTAPIHDMTWAPGCEEIIADLVTDEGGFVYKQSARTYNQYKPPDIELGDASLAKTWLDHIRTVYPDDFDWIVWFLAHRVQKPHEKINHALVLGGEPRIGKDSILAPIRHIIGTSNFQECTPDTMVGNFKPFLKAVILRLNEGRDIGSAKYKLYEEIKLITAAPPEMLEVNEKHLKQYYIPNVLALIITTNYKTGGMYLPANDTRHYVAWSPLSQTPEQTKRCRDLHRWYEAGAHAFEHIAAYLMGVNLSVFPAKEPPPLTPAFHEMAASGGTAELFELADLIERAGNQSVITVSQIKALASKDLAEFIKKSASQLVHRMAECGYTPVRNPRLKTEVFRWKINGVRTVVYGRKTLHENDRVKAAEDLAKDGCDVAEQNLEL